MLRQGRLKQPIINCCPHSWVAQLKWVDHCRFGVILQCAQGSSSMSWPIIPIPKQLTSWNHILLPSPKMIYHCMEQLQVFLWHLLSKLHIKWHHGLRNVHKLLPALLGCVCSLHVSYVLVFHLFSGNSIKPRKKTVEAIKVNRCLKISQSTKICRTLVRCEHQLVPVDRVAIHIPPAVSII